MSTTPQGWWVVHKLRDTSKAPTSDNVWCGAEIGASSRDTVTYRYPEEVNCGNCLAAIREEKIAGDVAKDIQDAFSGEWQPTYRAGDRVAHVSGMTGTVKNDQSPDWCFINVVEDVPGPLRTWALHLVRKL